MQIYTSGSPSRRMLPVLRVLSTLGGKYCINYLVTTSRLLASKNRSALGWLPPLGSDSYSSHEVGSQGLYVTLKRHFDGGIYYGRHWHLRGNNIQWSDDRRSG